MDSWIIYKCNSGWLNQSWKGKNRQIALTKKNGLRALKEGKFDSIKQTDLSKICRTMRNKSAMGSATHRSRALAYTRPSRSSRSAQPRPTGNQSRSCQNHSLSSDIILQRKTRRRSGQRLLSCSSNRPSTLVLHCHSCNI